MAVLLLILKIIGIILLVAACIIALVLFFPIRYEAEGDIDQKTAKIRIRWLLRLVRFRFDYQNGVHAVLSVAFHTWDFTDPVAKEKRRAKKEEKARKKAKKAAKKREKSHKKAAKKRDAYRKEREKTGAGDKKTAALDVKQEPTTKSQTEVETKQRDQQREAETKQEDPRRDEETKQKEQRREEQTKQKEQRQTEDTVSAGEKSGKVREIISKIKNILHMISENEVIEAVFPKLQMLLYRIRPRVLEGNISFGRKDPADTGKIVGVLAMIPLFYQTKLRITPDFETDEDYIHGSASMRGRIQVIFVLIFAIRLFREPGFKKFIHEIRK